MGRIIGIDLGTSNSCMAILDEQKPFIIPNSEGKNLTPSIVAFKNDEVLIGDPAKRQALLNPRNTVTSVKKLVGKKYFEIEEFIKQVPYKIVKLRDDNIGIEVNQKVYTPQEISAFI